MSSFFDSIWLIPNGGFPISEVWQIPLLLILLLLSRRLAPQQKDNPETTKTSPRIWIFQNRSYLAFWLASLILFLVTSFLFQIEASITRFVIYLGALWIVIGLIGSLLKERFWSQSFSLAAYAITGLASFAVIGDSITLMERMTVQVGSIQLSAWGILAGIIAFAITLWISLGVSRVVEIRIQKVPRLNDSLKVLIAKIVRIASITIAVMIAISSMGVDLSALTVLGGAIGLGLGFGLQKVVSNFVSGIILLTDNSIKPGDVIEIDGTYGWINNLRARYASVITRDGTEHLIPNEDLITQKVINWSFTDNLVRLKIPVGVSYDADPHQCIEIVKAAASSVDRVLQDPAPVCLLKGFGDSSVDLELRLWISDPSNGVANVKSKVLLKIWDSLKANNIEIPFPQRDLHIRSGFVPDPNQPDESK